MTEDTLPWVLGGMLALGTATAIAAGLPDPAPGAKSAGAGDQFQSFGRLDELLESRLLSNPPTMAPPT
jgi:hypothetical protein